MVTYGHKFAAQAKALHSAGARVAFADPSADKAPRWHLLLTPGKVHRGDFGSLDLSRKVLEEMAANYVAEGKPERAVNYFHLGTSSTPGTPEQKVAAGWISDVRVTDAGLEVLISWTDRARGFILADELRYLSAEFVTASTDKRSGKSSGAKLLGAALLNDPFLTELPRVAASENTEANVDFSKQVRAWLRLAESATDAEVEATIAKLYGASVSLSESAGQVAKLAEQVKTITAERDALRAEGRVAEVKAFFDGLVRDGKMLPATREGFEKLALAHGLESVKFLEASPKLVPVGESAKGVAGVGADDAVAARKAFLDAVDARVKAGEKYPVAFAAEQNKQGALFVKAFGGDK